jgi:hypothetical protein
MPGRFPSSVRSICFWHIEAVELKALTCRQGKIHAAINEDTDGSGFCCRIYGVDSRAFEPSSAVMLRGYSIPEDRDVKAEVAALMNTAAQVAAVMGGKSCGRYRTEGFTGWSLRADSRVIAVRAKKAAYEDVGQRAQRKPVKTQRPARGRRKPA